MQKQNYPGIDIFRLIAALLIVAIHTAPFKGIDSTLDFLVTYCIGRVGVPFFLMVTGYFVLAPGGIPGGGASPMAADRVKRYVRKLLYLYLGATILYIPINLYADKRVGSVGAAFKAFVFDGTAYHLWYLPAAIMGILLLWFLILHFGPGTVAVIVIILYILGTLGDSYYGLIKNWEPARRFYESIFIFSSYTRNGIFYAPVFLWLGRAIAETSFKTKTSEIHLEKKGNSKIWIVAGVSVSLVLMLAEGLLSYSRGWQKHNSMYFMLVPLMYFLFRGLLEVKGRSFAVLRDLSLWVYLIHPICILLVRVGARVVGLTRYLVEDQLLHYAAVVVLSILLSAGICYGKRFFARYKV